MSETILVLVLGAIFLVLWACIHFAIEGTALHSIRWVLGPAGSVLCLIGMMGGTKLQRESLIETVLVSWAALGWGILFVLLLLLLRVLWSRISSFCGRWQATAGLGEKDIDPAAAGADRSSSEGRQIFRVVERGIRGPRK